MSGLIKFVRYNSTYVALPLSLPLSALSPRSPVRDLQLMIIIEGAMYASNLNILIASLFV